LGNVIGVKWNEFIINYKKRDEWELVNEKIDYNWAGNKFKKNLKRLHLNLNKCTLPLTE